MLIDLAQKDSNWVSCRSMSTHQVFKAYKSNLVQPQCEMDGKEAIQSAS